MMRLNIEGKVIEVFSDDEEDSEDGSKEAEEGKDKSVFNQKKFRSLNKKKGSIWEGKKKSSNGILGKSGDMSERTEKDFSRLTKPENKTELQQKLKLIN